MNKQIKKLILAAIIVLLPFSVLGCEKKEESKRKDIDFTVCDKTRMPEELISIIEEKKRAAWAATLLPFAAAGTTTERTKITTGKKDLYLSGLKIYRFCDKKFRVIVKRKLRGGVYVPVKNKNK